MRFGEHSSQYVNKYTKEENQKFTENFAQITSEINELMKAGAAPSDSRVQEAIGHHYEFVCQFWKPDKDAYKNLAMTYILPTAYKDFYDNFEKGLGKFTYDAATIWADSHL